MPRKRRHEDKTCEECFGCGFICTRCTFPINACDCKELFTDDLECSEMAACEDCEGRGFIPADPPDLNLRLMVRM